MDLLKAREKARQKAREQEKEKEEGQKSSAKREEAASDVPAEHEEERPAPPAETEAADTDQSAPEETPVAETEKRTPPEEETAGPADSGFADMDDFSDEDVFTDDSFGEDLPPIAGEDPQESGDDSVLIHEEDEADIEKPAEVFSPAPEKPGPAERTKEEVRQPAGAESSQGPAADDQALFSSDDWSVAEHTSVEKARQSPEVPPTEQAPAPENGWTLEQMAPEEEDFFSLVTEELYLREFGADGSESEDQFSLLSFRLANETYAVRLTSIRQIIKLVPITMVPRVPDYVLGIISLRGTVIPVFDLRRVLKLPEAESTRKSRIIIVNQGKFTAGLIVDEVEQVVRMSESKIEPPPPVLGGVEAEYIKGIGRVDSKMIIFLSLEKIMVPVG